MSSKNATSEFQKTGFFPLDKDAVATDKIVATEKNQEEQSEKPDNSRLKTLRTAIVEAIAPDQSQQSLLVLLLNVTQEKLTGTY